MSLLVYILAGMVLVGGYRLLKRISRRCPCGSLRFKWIHKLEKSERRMAGLHISYTFRDCCSCGTFQVMKVYEKRFTDFGLRWRRFFHPSQFVGTTDCLVKAKILGSGSPRRQVNKTLCMLTTPSAVYVHSLGRLDRPVHREGIRH